MTPNQVPTTPPDLGLFDSWMDKRCNAHEFAERVRIVYPRAIQLRSGALVATKADCDAIAAGCELAFPGAALAIFERLARVVTDRVDAERRYIRNSMTGIPAPALRRGARPS